MCLSLKYSGHTLKFVFPDIDKSGWFNHIRCKVVYHIAAIISPEKPLVR